MSAEIRSATPADADAIVSVFCGSKRQAMPWLEESYPPNEVYDYIANVLLKTARVWVAIQGGRVVGYAALQGAVLEQLFVAADVQQQGVGSQLLEMARRTAGAQLNLYVFTGNLGARRFYERHGFVSTGAGTEEGEPDLLYEWRITRSAPVAV